MAKRQPKPVTAVATKPTEEDILKDAQDDIDDTPAALPQLDPLTDEELESLIGQGETLVMSDVSCVLVAASRELVVGLLERNGKNRYMTAGYVKDLTSRFLTPLTDDRGQPIKGTSQWVYGMPTQVFLTSDLAMHNAQHSLTAWLRAKEVIAKNQSDIENGIDVEIDYVGDLGIDDGMLDQFTLLIIRDIPDEAVNLIDSSKQRTVSDVYFLQSPFADCDYSSLAKDEQGVSNSQLATWQNEEAKKLATALRILYYRFAFNGAGPRGSSAKFQHSTAVKQLQDFPGMVDSVHTVWSMVKAGTETIKGSAALKSCGVSLQYLSVAHYLISMANAKFDKKSKTWRPTEEDWNAAYDFVYAVVFNDQEYFKGHKLSAQVRTALATPEGSVDSNGNPPAHCFAEGNRGLDAKFNALGWMYRDVAGLAVDPKLVTIATVCSGAAGFARYTDDPAGFDVVPQKEIPNPADVRRRGKPAVSADAPAAPAPTSATGSPRPLRPIRRA